MNGRPSSITAEFEGEWHTLNYNQWSLLCGIAAGTLQHRIEKAGIDPTEAVNKKPNQRHNTKQEIPGDRDRMTPDKRLFLYPHTKEVLTGASECGIMGVRTSEVLTI